jgi:molybdopterin molybdotransferase
LWGRDPHQLVSLAQAWETIASQVQPIGVEEVALADAHGRILAESIRINEDSPPFDKAVMDGFAVRSADCAAPGATLRVVGMTAAGQTTAAILGVGEALQINTGAPMPSGADAVARIEDCVVSADQSHVEIKATQRAGQNVAPRASHRRSGEVVLAARVRLGPAQIASVAAAGGAKVSVSKAVHAAIVATGDELARPGSAKPAGHIYESNGPMLAALVREFGGVPVDLGIVKDDAAALKQMFADALKHPVVIAAGGMSMGTLDLVPTVLAELGVKWLFHGVEMRPGKPTAYGRGPAGQHVFGLPGNPGSAFVCAWLMVRMVVRGLSGLAAQQPPTVRATLATELKPAKDARPAYVPARVWSDASKGMMVEALPWGGSGDVFGLAAANALLVLSAPTQAMNAGQHVDVIALTSLV